jgi:hypothetical protein
MNRIIICVIGGALSGASSLIIANAQQGPGGVFSTGDYPVTEGQVPAKLQSDGGSNVVISHASKYFQATAAKSGQTAKSAVDSQMGRLRVTQSQAIPNPSCPAGYWQMESLCLSASTGDVVNASAPVTSPITSQLGCRSGYWRFASVCLNLSTGDVELVNDEK